MADIKRCERCSKVYEPQDVELDNRINTDLCNACLNSFKEFMKNKEGMIFLDYENTSCKDCVKLMNNVNTVNNEISYCSIHHSVKNGYEKVCVFFKPRPSKV